MKTWKREMLTEYPFLTTFQPHSNKVQSITFLVRPTSVHSELSDGRGTETSSFAATFGETLWSLAIWLQRTLSKKTEYFELQCIYFRIVIDDK